MNCSALVRECIQSARRVAKRQVCMSRLSGRHCGQRPLGCPVERGSSPSSSRPDLNKRYCWLRSGSSRRYLVGAWPMRMKKVDLRQSSKSATNEEVFKVRETPIDLRSTTGNYKICILSSSHNSSALHYLTQVYGAQHHPTLGDPNTGGLIKFHHLKVMLVAPEPAELSMQRRDLELQRCLRNSSRWRYCTHS